ncbi:hypothetical protein NDU88_001113 [Pleurodeles waltl]|uniref:Uncharacterized protein n=1 Tax=Pleurodeles waltl TaxID=8319 RepID=A0AAV7V8P5_PLEWA|nr:hypothetical protein NDU88_001113 [Pleurodeles waltl]
MATSATGQLAQLLQHLKKLVRCGRHYRRAPDEAQLRESIQRGRSITGWLRDFNFRFRHHRGGSNGHSRVDRLPPLLYELLQVRGMSHSLRLHITALPAAPDPTVPAPRCWHVPLCCTTRGAAR